MERRTITVFDKSKELQKIEQNKCNEMIINDILNPLLRIIYALRESDNFNNIPRTDVSKKTVPQKIPRRYREDIKRLQERYDLHEGLVINVSLKEFRGICERDYPKIEAYLGLRKYLLRTFGVTLNIHSQKTKGGSDKTIDEP